MLYRNIVRENNVPFDEITVPSRGIFYSDKKETFLVKYVTAKEENLLTSPTLIESGKALEMLMSSCLLDWGGDIDNLLIGDRDAFMVYLRSTSYGDKVNFNYRCPSCGNESEASFHLSHLEMKELSKKDMPDENLEHTFVMPKMKIKGSPVVIKFRPKRLKDERLIKKIVKEEFKYIGDTKVDNTIEATYRNQITSINGVINPVFIKSVIKNMPINDSRALRSYMEKVEPGVDNDVKSTCTTCGHVQSNKIPIDSNFFGLNAEYRQHMMDEIFLITYYGKGGFSRDDVFNMPVYERRWVMQRIQEEVEKKNKADREAASRARSQAKSGRV
tara:strand:+ start:432 stop:1421 length:990 start_codon:yes stop_codon:yes gene_type:complete